MGTGLAPRLGAPRRLDSRLRGNDGKGAGGAVAQRACRMYAYERARGESPGGLRGGEFGERLGQQAAAAVAPDEDGVDDCRTGG